MTDVADSEEEAAEQATDNSLPALQVLQSLNTGIAMVEPDSWKIISENGKFFQWFPNLDDQEDTLVRRIAKFEDMRAKDRLDKGRPYKFEREVKDGVRSTPVRVEMRPLTIGDETKILVECFDITKIKEAEYMLQSYASMSEKHTRELEREKERVERLLLNVMPKSVYEEMKDFGTTTPTRVESASVLMLDFVNFTEMSVSRDPSTLVAELNDIFSAFDRIVELFGCERIKTIGDAYIAVSGLPEETPDHASNVAKVALRMKRYIERRNIAHPEPWQCRIGINSGPMIGSIVGVQKYVYDIFGPGVNLAARMEFHSDPMQITLTEETRNLLSDDFIFTERGEYEIKGFGKKTLYFLDGETSSRR
jgi:class 3 adenylate cyclase